MKIQWKLKARLASSVSVLIVLAMVALGLTMSWQFRAAMEAQVQAALLSDAEAFKAQALEQIDARSNALRTWAEDPIIRGALFFFD